jgi:4-hydroxy-tetrahydrodipicolinate synthase
MATKFKAQGILPSVCVIYKDKSCRELDEEAYRSLLRWLLEVDIGGLVVGGHAGETECMNMDERLRVIKIAQEEAQGKVPIIGGVISDATWMAVEQGKRQKDAGVDAVLFMPPTIIAWDPNTSEDLTIEHVKKFDREVGLPFIFFGGPKSEGSYNFLPKTFKRLAVETENLVAWKITTRYDLGGFISCVNAFKAAEKETGRHVAPLIAGDHILVEALREGADGNLNGGEIYRAPEDVAIYKAVKKGDLTEAFAIQDRLRPVTDAIRGIMYGYSHTYFHYRYKVAAWLLGKIPRPHMRLPQLPVSKEEVELIRDALIKSGMNPVREAEQFEIADM